MAVIDGRLDLLTPRQREANRLLAGPARYLMLYGGSRSGKTFVIVRAMIMRALKGAGSRQAIWRFRYNAVHTSVVLDTFPKVVSTCYNGLEVEHKKQDGYILFPNGSQIFFGGLDEAERVERVLGQEHCGIFFNEASQIPYSSVLLALTRLAQNVVDGNGHSIKQRAYFDANPPSTGHYTNRLWLERRDPISKATLPNPQDYAYLAMNPTDNPQLSSDYLAILQALPERQRRRFLEGRFTDDAEGALWTLDTLEACRATSDDLPPLKRVVVAVDPSGAAGPDDKRSDEIGIVVAGLAGDGHAYILADHSLRANPGEWARVVLAAYDKHEADRIVAERNYGGELVRHTIRTHRATLPVRLVTASRGKAVRAEPVSALYEQRLVHHIGRFPELEDQMLAMTAAGYTGDRSPDRLDALVWAISDLMLNYADHGPSAGPVSLEKPAGGYGGAWGGPGAPGLGGGDISVIG